MAVVTFGFLLAYLAGVATCVIVVLIALVIGLMGRVK